MAADLSPGELLRDVAASGVDEKYSDPSYVTVQIDRDTWEQVQRLCRRHVTGIRSVRKMDLHEPAFGPVCSCGWNPGGVYTEQMAMRAATAHANARTGAEGMVPVEQVRAALRLLSPDHLTAMGRRQLERVLDAGSGRPQLSTEL